MSRTGRKDASEVEASGIARAGRSLRCAIYTRKSTEEGLEQAFNSLDAQREACEAYVRSQTHEGWIALPALYDDGGFSGGNMDRPALKRLLADIDRGLVDVVVVYKVDRLTRSLADFAKIVERFDRRNVSFVSVTQAFNTTNSMGRLTLNVLLSFAQFEREVTSERIRDKIAASRKKGMWMGGKSPFGYVVRDKKIYPDPVEAPIVRRIYERYLELGSVTPLRDALEAEGVISKPYVSRHGRPYGGKAFDRGALYHLLQNRIYIGEVRHKAHRYKGEHEAIVPIDLFEAVQRHLASTRRRSGDSRTAIHHPLAGLLHDSAGNRMSPSHGRSQGRRYRYYVSRAALGSRTRPGAITRIPAEPIEALVLGRIAGLVPEADASASVGTGARKARDATAADTSTPTASGSSLRALIERVTLKADTIVITLRREQIAARLDDEVLPNQLRARLVPGDDLAEDGDRLVLTVHARPVRRGGAVSLEPPAGHAALCAPHHDPALLKAIARAHHWLDLMTSGAADTLKTLARHENLPEGYVARMIPLAFLPPADLAAILADRQGPDVTVERLTRTAPSDVARLGTLSAMSGGVPLAWPRS